MKKDKEWLRNELLNSRSANRGMILTIGEVMELVYQLDEPEKVIIPQFMADWICQAKKWGYSISDSMRHVGSYFGTTQYDKAVYWANKNQDIFARAWLEGYEVEKIVIPQFVADWWERDGDSVTMYGKLRVEKKHKFDLISIFYDKGLGDYLSKAEDWIYENDSAFLDLVNGKPYEVEKEKLYVVELINNHLTRCLAYDLVDKVFFISQTQEEKLNKFKKRFTEQEIKNYDERFWPFAVEVAE